MKNSNKTKKQKNETFHHLIEVWEKSKDQTEEEYRQDISHWRHVGRWKDDEAWQRIGSRSFRLLEAVHRYSNLPLKWGEAVNILEWGPGGGANLFAFRNLCKNYFGIDISEKNLAEAQRMIDEEGNDIFRPVFIQNPSDALEQIDEKVDCFLSTATFQHFPSQEYGIQVLEIIAKLCKKDALGFIQIRYRSSEKRYRGIKNISQYKEHHIRANSYEIDQFHDLCNEAGFNVISVRDINSAVHYATYMLRYRG